MAQRLNVAENVIFTGETDNPYTWLKACDIYVHPSRYEGKSIVVREAQLLCKPVVITDYPTARSQVRDEIDGVISDMDNTGIAKTILALTNDIQRRNKIVSYLRQHDFAGKEDVGKIYRLVLD